MSEREQRIRIAVVDDHEMFRAGVIATLQPYFDVVGQAADVEGSVAMIAQTKPDVVLLDVHVPGGEGGGGTEILTKSRPYSPDTVFLALSVSDSPQDVGSVIRAGAQGYVTKTISGDDLVSSIKQVHEGYAVFSPKLAGFVLSAFQNGPSANGAFGGPIHDDELDRLSNREQEVMRLIARGYTLHLNGFQDRLFRPLRHLPFAPNIAATHETPIYHSARKCDTWHSLHPRRFQQKTAHASAQNDTNGTGTVQHTKSGAGTNANAAFTDSYQTRTSWKIRLPTWSAR